MSNTEYDSLSNALPMSLIIANPWPACKQTLSPYARNRPRVRFLITEQC